MQVRNLPDVMVLNEFGDHGVSIAPGQQLAVQVLVTPRSYGIICTLLMLDFGKLCVCCIWQPSLLTLLDGSHSGEPCMGWTPACSLLRAQHRA